MKIQAGPLGKIIDENFSEELLDELAGKTGFIKRSRKLSATHFVNILMFSSGNQADTSLPDITADLRQQFSVDISKEGMHKRFNTKAVSFLKELIKYHVSEQLLLEDGKELKRYFNAINIKDSTKFSLPSVYNGHYPGFGNFSKTNGLMNIQYEYDILSGNWKTVDLTSIKVNDQKDSNQNIESISSNELYIRDLGYITPTYLNAVLQKGASFLNRLPAQAAVYASGQEQINWNRIDRKFNKAGTDTLDMDVCVYKNEQIACRLIIERVPNDVYRKRVKQAEASAKKYGVGLTQQRRTRCRYNTFITNVDRLILPTAAIRKVYHLRWQVELVFKTWKSFLEIDKLKKVKRERFECQLLAKLLWVLLNWRLFQSCNHHVQKERPTIGVSILKFFKRCLCFSGALRLVVLRRIPLQRWLKQTFLPLIENTACEAPIGKTTHYLTLFTLS